VGKKLNNFNSLSHAEAQSLMNAGENSGFLPKKVTTYVDRIPCDWCENDKALSALTELYKIQEWKIIPKQGEGLIIRPNAKPQRFKVGEE
jgi:hypothetical protein